ncbi:TPA: IS1-like element transposase, partial [Escherichia coli]
MSLQLCIGKIIDMAMNGVGCRATA